MLPVTETDVQVKTPDGVCDAAFFHPTTGTHPGVLFWPDALGLRPAFRAMGRRMAAEGYAVLVVNQFYRMAMAPIFDSSKFSFSDPEQRAQLMKLMGGLTPQTVESDARAFVAFIDAQPAMKKGAKIGTVGYCMGGSMTMRTAAVLPDRIGAGVTFHGGGLATDKPESPHLLAPKIKAKFLIAVASDDDTREPEAKNVVKAAFAAAGNPAVVEVYDGLHGWCMTDMPPRDANTPVYNKAEAERGWANMLKLFKQALG